MIPLITIIGRSGSGKTTLMEKLIAELKRRSYRVAAIKHHTKLGFVIDIPGKDSWRFAQAGSDQVIIAAPDRIASYRNLDHELTLDEIAAEISAVDIILVEGYKQAGKPALAVARQANNPELVGSPAQRLAVVVDFPMDTDVPIFGLDDIQGIANLIEHKFLHPAAPPSTANS